MNWCCISVWVNMNQIDNASLSASDKQSVYSAVVSTASPAREIFDRVFAAAVLLFGFPFLVLVIAALFFSQGSPVMFAHKRVGKNGKEFKCLKFRTMVVDAEERLAEHLASNSEARAQWENWRKLEDDPRVTCVGEFLRKTALDELPQFINVLRGEMSIVGPRPIVRDELKMYAQHAGAYLSVKPGITGLWQVEAKEIDTYEDRVALDMEYLQRRSFLFDLSLIMRTAVLVLKRGGSG